MATACVVQGSGASLSTGAGDVPYYMEVSLRGYKDDTEDIDAGEGTVTDIIGPFIFELGYLKFDMSIGPEGAVYNFWPCDGYVYTGLAVSVIRAGIRSLEHHPYSLSWAKITCSCKSCIR